MRAAGASGPPPWLRAPASVPRGAAVAVVGAGVAGCAVAGALRRAGYAVTMIDRAGRVGAEASGNPCGLLKPRLTADGGLHGRFYGQGYQHAVAVLDDIGGWLARGILSVARDVAEAETMARLAGTLPAEHLKLVDAAEAKALAGITAPWGGLWFPQAGAIDPVAVCAALAGGTDVRQADLARLEAVAEGWRLVDTAGAEVARAAAVVLAAGPWAPSLWPAAELPVHANRGQITLMTGAEGIAPVSLSYGGYLSPPVVAGQHVLGATYGRVPDLEREDWRTALPGDDAANLDLLGEVLPDVRRGLGERTASRVSLRATIADHMPVMGPLFDASAWREVYADLHHGRAWDHYQPAPLAEGLFVLGGLGSRGFQTAPLLAEALAAMMAGGAGPLAADLLAAIHPGRFLIRTLRRPPRGRVPRPPAVSPTA